MKKAVTTLIKKIIKEEVNLLKFRRNILFIDDILWEIMGNYDVVPTQSGEKMDLPTYKSEVIGILQDVLFDEGIADSYDIEEYNFLYDFFGEKIEKYWKNWEPYEDEYENIVESTNILTEDVSGIDDFIKKIVKNYPKFEPFSSNLTEFIEKSGCKKIEFADFDYPASGVALHDGVLINNKILKQGLAMLLFVIFHEVAHQFQYKKYGAKALYKVYSNEMDVNDAAKLMHDIEIVADEFASRKVREYKRMGAIKNEFVSPQVYKNVPIQRLVGMIEGFRKKLYDKFPEGNATEDEISKLFSDMIVSKGLLGLGILGL